MGNINCVISHEQHLRFYKKITGDIWNFLKSDVVKENPIAKFPVKDYLQSVYDKINADGTRDAIALDYVRLIPKNILSMVSDHSELFQNVDLSELQPMLIDFEKNIKSVRNYLKDKNQDIKDAVVFVEAVKTQELSNPLPKQEELSTKPVVEPNSFNARSETVQKTVGTNVISSNKKDTENYNKLSTDPRVIFTSGVKEYVARLVLNSKADNRKTAFHNEVGEMFFKIVSLSTIDKKYYPANFEKFSATDVALIIVDKDGNPVYFNETNYAPNIKGEGKLFVDDFRTRNPEETELNASDKNSVKALIRNNPNLSEEEGEAIIKQQYQQLQKVRDYVNQDKGKNFVMANIDGGSVGYVNDDYKQNVPLSRLSWKNDSFNPEVYITQDKNSKSKANSEKRNGHTYFEVATIPGRNFEIKQVSVSQELAEDLATLLFDKYDYIFKNRVRPFTNLEKVAIFKSYFRANDTSLIVNHNSNNDTIEIILDGKPLNFENIQDNKNRLIQYLTQKAPKAKMLIINKSMINSEIKIPTFSRKENGQLELRIEEIPYKKYILDNFLIDYELNADNQIVLRNPWLSFNIRQDSLAKIEPNYKEELEPKVELIPNVNPTLEAGPSDEDISYFGTLDKNKKQKSMNEVMTPEQLKEAERWWNMKENDLNKHFKLKQLFDVVNARNPDSVASWSLNGITLFKGSDFSDVYHEAWHGFTQTFLTKEQRTSLYNETRNKKGSFTSYRGKAVKFSTASDIEIEEYLAEDFRTYMLKGQKVAPNSPARNSIFRKIWDMLKALFGNSSVKEILADEKSNAVINELYNKLRVGNLSEYSFSSQNVQFSELNKGLQATDINEKQQELGKANSKLVVDTMNSLFSQYIDVTSKFTDAQSLRLQELELRKDSLSPQEQLLYKGLQKMSIGHRFTYMDLVSPKGIVAAYSYAKRQIPILINKKQQEFDEATDTHKQSQLKNYIDLLSYMYNNFGNLEDITKNDRVNGVGVIGYHQKKSKWLSKDVITNLLEEIGVEDKANNKLFDRSGNDTSFFEMAKVEIAFMVSTLHKVDEKGKPIMNNLGVPELVNARPVMTRIMKTLVNTPSREAMYRKLQTEAKIYPIFNQLLEKLGPPDSKAKDGTILVNDYIVWQKFNHTFYLTQTPPQQANLDFTTTTDARGVTTTNAIPKLVVGNPSGDEQGKVLQNWDNEFKTNYNNEYIDNDKEGNFMDIESISQLLKSYPILNENNVIEFLNAIGINIIDNTATNTKSVKSEILTDAKPIWQRLRFVIELQADGEINMPVIRTVSDLIKDWTPFIKQGVDLKNKGALKDTSGRLKGLAKIHSRFSDSNSDFMRSNAKGDTWFELTTNSTLTQILNGINEVNSWAELMSSLKPEFAHFRPAINNAVMNSVYFNTIFDFNDELNGFPKRKYKDKKNIKSNSDEGETARLEIYNLTGVAKLENGENISEGADSFSASALDKFLYDFHLSLVNVSEITRLADKGTSSAIKPSHYLIDGVVKRNFVEIWESVKQGDLSLVQYKRIVELENLQESGQTLSPAEKDELEDLQSLPGYQNTALDKFFKNVMIPYISSELQRINKCKLIQKQFEDGVVTITDFDFLKRGLEFQAFDDVLSKTTKAALYELSSDVDLKTHVANDAKLTDMLLIDLRHYFEGQVNNVEDEFNKNPFVSNEMYTIAFAELQTKHIVPQRGQMIRGLIRNWVVNTWATHFESTILVFGDIAQYKAFYKRNALFGSPGIVPETGPIVNDYINNSVKRPYTISQGFGNNYTHDGRFQTGVLEDSKVTSKFLKTHFMPAMEKKIRKDFSKRPSTKDLSKSEFEIAVKKELFETLEPYGLKEDGTFKPKIDEGDAQGWITLDSYRIIMKLYDQWGPEQEKMYQEELSGKPMSMEDYVEFFAMAKLQYSGPVENDLFPLMAAHKYALMPLIPSVIEKTNLKKLHTRMMSQGLDYVVYQSGSKIMTLTTNNVKDKMYTDVNGRVMDDATITKNPIFLAYLKYQTHIEPSYKEEVSLPTQMRAIILDGYYENGVPTDYMPDADKTERLNKWNELGSDKKLGEQRQLEASPFHRLVKTYEGLLFRLVDARKKELLREAKWDYNNGNPIGKLDDLLKFIYKQLEREDLTEEELSLIDPIKGTLKHDPSLSSSASTIEKLLNAIVIKRLAKPKVNGEGLLLVSGAGYENVDFAYGPNNKRNLEEPTEDDLINYGTNDVPFYYVGKDGLTNASKCKIALQNNFVKLLKLKEVVERSKKESITPLEALNLFLKDKEWLDKGDNRKMITILGPRIPSQKQNSLDFMEVYEFLLPKAGTILVPPLEIIPKTGGDNDGDKIFFMFKNLQSKDGVVSMHVQHTEKEAKELYEKYKEYKIKSETEKEEKQKESRYKALGINAEVFAEVFEGYEIDEFEEILLTEGKIMTFEHFFETLNGSKAVENELQDAMIALLRQPFNYLNLITPNSVTKTKPVAEDLKNDVIDYSPNKSSWSNNQELSKASLTRTFEILENKYKHDIYNVAKQTLAIIAIENKWNPVFNRIGMHMNPFYTNTTGARKNHHQRRLVILMPTRTITVDGQQVISLSHSYDVLNENEVAEIFSQLVNGIVDAANDEWAVYIQANKEVIPTVAYLMNAGMSFKQAAIFVSQPLIREYVQAQQTNRGMFARAVGIPIENPNFYQRVARVQFLNRFHARLGDGKVLPDNLSNKKIYELIVQKTSENIDSFDLSNPSKLQAIEHNIKRYKNAKKDKTGSNFSDQEIAHLMHFIELEDQVKGLRNLKMGMNLDTNKQTTLFDAQNRPRLIEEIRLSGMFPESMVDKLLKDSPIGPFDIQEFQSKIWKSVMPLRNNDEFGAFMMEKIIEDEERETPQIEPLFEDLSDFAEKFKDGFPSYIFQNELKKFDYNKVDSYKGLAVSTSAISPETRLLMQKSGIHLDYASKTVHIDKQILKANFKSKTWSQAGNNLGTAPVSTLAFNEGNLNEYVKFVIERELVRYQLPQNKAEQRFDFKDLFELNFSNTKKFKDETDLEFVTRIKKKSYEELLRNQSLTNIYNFWQLFQSESSFADQFYRIRKSNPDLEKEFAVIQALSMQPTKGRSGIKNLKLNDSKLDVDTIEQMQEEINKLANHDNIIIPNNPEENKRVTDFFSKFSVFAYLQSGIDSSSPLSLIRLSNPRQFLRITEPITKDMLKNKLVEGSPEAYQLLSQYYGIFMREYSNRATRYGFKNWTVPVTAIPTVQIGDRISPYGPGVSVILTENITEDEMNKLVESHSDSVFVYPGAYVNTNGATNGSSVFVKSTMNNVFPLMTNKQYTGSNVDMLIEDSMDENGTEMPNVKIKELVDETIQSLLEQQKAGKTIVFNEGGFGQASLRKSAPITFDYVSQQLFEHFGFVNPNSLKIDVVSRQKEIVSKFPVRYVESGSLNEEIISIETKIDNSKKINIYASTNENAELSNFANRPFSINGQKFNTVEGAFQAAKLAFTNNFTTSGKLNNEEQIILDKLKTASGSQAKALGRTIKELDSHSWDKVSSNRMLNFIRESFKQNLEALEKLLATGNAELTHTQDKGKWGKEFPKLLMQVRDELSNTSQSNQSKVAATNTGSEILLDNELLLEEFKQKVWANPPIQKDGSKVKPIPLNQFFEFNSYKAFVVLQQRALLYLKKTANETIVQYEDRINNEALAIIKNNSGQIATLAGLELKTVKYPKEITTEAQELGILKKTPLPKLRDLTDDEIWELRKFCTTANL